MLLAKWTVVWEDAQWIMKKFSNWENLYWVLKFCLSWHYMNPLGSWNPFIEVNFDPSSPSPLPLSLTFWAFSSLPCPHPINPAKSHINKLWIATIATNLSHLWRFHNDSYLPSFNSTAPHTNTSQISQGFIDGQIGHLPVLNTTPDANTSQISHGCACIDVTDRLLAWWNK